MELSDLCMWDDTLMTMDDRTGTVFKVLLDETTAGKKTATVEAFATVKPLILIMADTVLPTAAQRRR